MQESRRTAFSRLLLEAPDVAVFLRGISAAFGKPAAVDIRFTNGDRFITGRFMAAHDYHDFSARCEKHERQWLDGFKRHELAKE